MDVQTVEETDRHLWRWSTLNSCCMTLLPNAFGKHQISPTGLCSIIDEALYEVMLLSKSGHTAGRHLHQIFSLTLLNLTLACDWFRICKPTNGPSGSHSQRPAVKIKTFTFSECAYEHTWSLLKVVTVFPQVHIGYLPNKRVLGLSKLARWVQHAEWAERACSFVCTRGGTCVNAYLG